MNQKDFILRMIEMLAKMVAGILGLIKKGEFKKDKLVSGDDPDEIDFF